MHLATARCRPTNDCRNQTRTWRSPPVISSARNLSGHSSVPGFGELRMSDVLVSFVVPAYNEEVLIRSCLAAITAEVSRTGCRAEIIVVNNASTDGTRRIALSTPGVKV